MRTARERTGWYGRLRMSSAGVAALLVRRGGGQLRQKPGGILKMYIRDSPASMSILEEATLFAVAADDGGVQQSGHVRPARQAEQPAIDRPRSRHRLVVERGRDRAHLPAAPGRQMARRQAVHRQGRQMHLGSADRQGEREAARQSAQVLVSRTSKRSPPTATTRSPSI